MTEEDMKEFQGFYDEIRAIRDEMERLNARLAKEGFTKDLVKQMNELIARQERLIAKQKEFGRKHKLLP